jgi:hypothetical protein
MESSGVEDLLFAAPFPGAGGRLQPARKKANPRAIMVREVMVAISSFGDHTLAVE